MGITTQTWLFRPGDRTAASTLPDVGQSEESFEQTAVVHASVERVMAWWFHEDRLADLQRRVERNGVAVSMTRSTLDGMGVMDLRWTDRRGWDHHNHDETRVGMPVRRDDRFVQHISEVRELRHASGKKRRVTCSGRIEFVPQANGDTQITAFHHHVRVGGGWIERWSNRRREWISSERLFLDMIAECEAALNLSG